MPTTHRHRRGSICSLPLARATVGPYLLLELGPDVRDHRCRGCGAPVRCGRGSVYDDAGELARYWFHTLACQRAPGVRLLVALDGAADTEGFVSGVSFAIWGRSEVEGRTYSFVPPEESPIVLDPQRTGPTLAPERARRHPARTALWRIVDYVAEHDPELCRFLQPP